MSLAKYNRVIYKKNPLIQVVCQLRFPHILMINERQPAAFQEKIRNKFPLFQVSVEQQQQLTFDLGAMGSPPQPRLVNSESINNYQFTSMDGFWTVNLTSTFLALSTTKYRRWEEFKENLELPLQALIETYNPAIFERIGLRYVDAFKRSELNLNGIDWSELFQPFVLGFMSDPEIKSKVLNQQTIVELDIGSDSTAQINIRKGIPSNSKFDYNVGFDIEEYEESFIVDSDMYVMNKEINELNPSLNHLHDNSTNLLRSIITEKLHNAMDPEAI